MQSKISWDDFFEKYHNEEREIEYSLCEIYSLYREYLLIYLNENLKKGDVTSLVKFLIDFVQHSFFEIIIDKDFEHLLNIKDINLSEVFTIIDSHPMNFLLSPTIVGLDIH